MKSIKYILTALGLFALVATPVLAEGANFSVRLSAPKSPTNQTSFKLTYVVLDLESREFNVSCFKKGPLETTYSQFGATQTVSAGGNTSFCQADTNIIKDAGTYSFMVKASTGSQTPVESEKVAVDFRNSTPDTPNSFSKERINDCEYKIKFRTGADNGKTVKVEIFRSENRNFGIDGGNRIAVIGIGSDQAYEFTDKVSNCSKEYFYAIRALDSADNVSGVTGDSITKTIEVVSTTITPSPTTGAQVASNGSQVPSEKAGQEESEESKEGQLVGEGQTTGNSNTGGVLGRMTENSSMRNWLLIIAGFIIGGLIAIKVRKSK